MQKRGAGVLELSWSFFAVAGPAVAFAGMSKGGFGGGAGFVASLILALLVAPGLALGIMLPLLMLMDLATMRAFWRKWNTGAALLLILGALPGLVLGGWLYRVASPEAFKLLIGVIALAFVAWQGAGKYGLIRLAARPMPAWGGAIAGAVAGFTSFVSHAGGPPVAIYLLSRRLPKTEFQATTVLVFWIINLVKFPPYLYLGLFTAETAKANLLLAPFALLGVWLGVIAHRRVPERLFFAITYVLLTLTGTKLIWDALS